MREMSLFFDFWVAGKYLIITAASGSSRVYALFRSTAEAPEIKATSSSDRILGFTKQNIVISPVLILYKEGVRPITPLFHYYSVCSLSVVAHSKSRQSYFLAFW